MVQSTTTTTTILPAQSKPIVSPPKPTNPPSSPSLSTPIMSPSDTSYLIIFSLPCLVHSMKYPLLLINPSLSPLSMPLFNTSNSLSLSTSKSFTNYSMELSLSKPILPKRIPSSPLPS